MDSSKMISEQLFLLIPMLYNQIIRPIEGALRAKISPLQFYALMALKREGCMTMSALSGLIFICLSAYGEAQMDKLRAAVCRGIEEHLPFSPRENRRSCCFPWKLFGK